MKDGELHLFLENIYLMFSLEKNLIQPASTYVNKAWDQIMTNEIDVGYAPIGFEEICI
jgi:hypothetical protein